MAPFFFSYLLKLSLSLAVVYLFYRLVLQNLTFYSWNRWYLLGFTALSFLIPLVDISALWEGNAAAPLPAVTQYIPPVEVIASTNLTYQVAPGPAFDHWHWLLLALLTGMAGLLVRAGLQVWALLRIRQGARLISDQDIKIYQVDADILPFSFGRSVFLNRALHRQQDLPEIIRHELVHVQQVHTADIIWMELVCILNWYNPFAWLLRRQLRQNLEYIADRQVLQAGIDKKHYQYLLLQVTGGPALHLANQFNFSSLKKRIMMMNKMPSSRPQLARFLFLLPLVALLLLAFRGAEKTGRPAEKGIINNTAALQNPVEEKQFPTQGTPAQAQDPNKGHDDYQLFMQRNPQVKGLSWQPDNKLVISLRSGKQEKYDLQDEASQAALEKKYGKLPAPPPPPPAAPVPPAVPAAPAVPGTPGVPAAPAAPAVAPPPPPQHIPPIREEGKTAIKIQDGGPQAVLVTFQDGSQEKYDLSTEAGKQAFLAAQRFYGDSYNPADSHRKWPEEFKTFLTRNPQIAGMRWRYDMEDLKKGDFAFIADRLFITLKSGAEEVYVIESKSDLARVEQKFGKLPLLPPPMPTISFEKK